MKLEQFFYTVQMNFINFKRDISNLWFSVRLSYYKFKYKGGQNIPGEIVGKLLGDSKDMEALGNEMLCLRHVQEICALLIIPYEESVTYSKFGEMIRGELERIEDSQIFDKALTSDHKRKAMFDVMVAFGDIEKDVISKMQETDEWPRFYRWLMEVPPVGDDPNENVSVPKPE